MTSQMPHAARTQHLLALMKHGDDGFNRRDPDIFHALHHPDMVAHIMGSADPIRGRDALAAALAGMIAASRTYMSRTIPIRFNSPKAIGSR